MSEVSFSVSLCFTHNHIYVMEREQAGLSVKVFDASQKVLGKRSFSDSKREIPKGNSLRELPPKVLEELIPPRYLSDFKEANSKEKKAAAGRSPSNDDCCQKSHRLLLDAQAAMDANKAEEALSFCKKAESLCPESFLNICVQLELFKKQNQTENIKNKILSWLERYENTASVSSKILAYKMLVDLNYSPKHCLKIIQLYYQESLADSDEAYKSGMREKTLKWLLVFIEHIQRESTFTGETSEKQPLYQILNDIDTKNSLKDEWNRLIQIYLKNDDLTSAKETCLLAFNKYPSFEIALQLGRICGKQQDKDSSLKWYAQACLLASDYQQRNDTAIELSSEVNYLLDKEEEGPAPRPVLSTCDWIDCSLPSAYDLDLLVEPHLPLNIRKILKKPCPFTNKTIGESHHFIFVISRWGLKLCQESDNEKVLSVDKGIVDDPRQTGYWLLITKEPIHSTIGCSRIQQCKILQEASKKTGLSYDFPTIANAICYPFVLKDIPSLTRCKEVGRNGEVIIVKVKDDGKIQVEHADNDSKIGTKAVVRLFPGNANFS